jgi:hypothetical protein
MRNRLKWFLLFAAALLFLILVPIVFLTGSDQLRPIPEPRDFFASAQTHASRATTGADAPTAPSLAQQVIGYLNWQEPDISDRPPEVQQAWREFRDECFDLFEQYLLLPEQTMEMPVSDAIDSLGNLSPDLVDLLKNHSSAGRPLDGQYGLTGKLFDLNNRIVALSQLKIYKLHNDWLGAAQTHMMMTADFDYESAEEFYRKMDWDGVVYYMRKGGMKGRFTLGIMSIHRRWTLRGRPVKESTEDNVESDNR